MISAALPYVNAELHAGNMIGCNLSADAFARFCRLMGKEVLFVGGTDEYGTATEIAAHQRGITPKELCDEKFGSHKKINDWFNISFDCYGRTSCADPSDESWPQTEIAHDIYKKIVKNEYTTTQIETRLYCEQTRTFASDRFIVGTCYLCGYEGAKGNQCDGCGQLMDVMKIIDPVFKLNPEYKLVKRDTEVIYFNIPKLQKELDEYFSKHSHKWTKVAESNTRRALTCLIDRSISRDLKWGTPIPDTEKYGDRMKNKILYPWFDAPIGYISITKQCIGDEYKRWWLDPENTELVQFMAKDNTLFHSVIFPASLIATGDNYTLPTTISSINYLQYGTQKFSKSNGTGIFCDQIMNMSYSSDYWRYYLLSIRPESLDSKFSWKGLFSAVNNDLFANFGNLISRVLNIAFKAFKKVGSEKVKFNGHKDHHEDCIRDIDTEMSVYRDHFTSVNICNAIRSARKMASYLNAYINETQAWTVLKKDEDTIRSEVFFLMYCLNKIISAYFPFVPKVCDEVKDIIGNTYDITDSVDINECEFRLPTKKPPRLFTLMDTQSISLLADMFGATDED